MDRNRKNINYVLEEQETDEQETLSFSLEEFTPQIFDCEADGSCGSGHIHLTQKDR